MKMAKDIIKWGVVKPFFDKSYSFNSIDIETIDNDMFIFGYIKNGKYYYHETDFYNSFNDLLINSVQHKKDILTWTRYDNTHLLKLLLGNVSKSDINDILHRIGKVSPVYEYKYKSFTITIVQIIKDSMIFKIDDGYNKPKSLVSYNLKNLYHTDLETTAKNYRIDYYNKIGVEYHIIDKERYKRDIEYKRLVLESNKLDSMVLIDIATKLLENFKLATGVYPKTIFTSGSIARSYLLASKDITTKDLQFKSIFSKSKLQAQLLDYSMRSYHGGKIESYVLGSIPSAKMIDITTAYPSALSNLPSLTGKVKKHNGMDNIDDYIFAFIRCDIYISDPDFIHPIIVKNPINKSNISPYGYMENVVITKVEYDYLIKNNIEVNVYDYIGCEHIHNSKPYKKLVDQLFTSRMKNAKSNVSLAQLYKDIINSLYGVTYELTDVYEEDTNGNIEWLGFRAGDFFNPVVSSYITATIRTYLSDVSRNIISNGGEVYLNMTDSIFYQGKVTLDVFSKDKQLGKFEYPDNISDIVILGAGRYEYKDDFKDKYVIKTRGFSANVKDKAFYRDLDLSDKVKIKHNTFVTSYKATTNIYSFQDMGYIIPDTYIINPFNLGGKRIIENVNVNLNKYYTKTKALYIEKNVLRN